MDFLTYADEKHQLELDCIDFLFEHGWSPPSEVTTPRSGFNTTLCDFPPSETSRIPRSTVERGSM